MVVSQNGRWLAWTDGDKHVFVADLDNPGSRLSLQRNYGAEYPPVFNRDSTMLFIESRGSIQRVALPADGRKPTALQPLATTIDQVLALAVFPPVGGLQEEIDGKLHRLAALGLNGQVEWWDFSDATLTPHKLPNLFLAYRNELRIIRLEREQIRGTIEWSPDGRALLATMAETSAEFGIAAVRAVDAKVDAKEGWRPIIHRYEAKYGTTTSRSQGSPGAATGYKVTNPGDLGASSARWLSSEGVVTLGFDGTLLARELAHLEPNRFWRVADQVSYFDYLAEHLVTGGRDGKLHFIDIEGIGDDERSPPLALNGHDAPIRELRGTLEGKRILSIDAAGVARIWSLSHPILSPDDTIGPARNWTQVLRRSKQSDIEVWPIVAPDPLWAPRVGTAFVKPKATALTDDGLWVATLDIEPASASPLILRLWSFGTGDPGKTPRVEHRYQADGFNLTVRIGMRLAV